MSPVPLRFESNNKADELFTSGIAKRKTLIKSRFYLTCIPNVGNSDLFAWSGAASILVLLSEEMVLHMRLSDPSVKFNKLIPSWVML